MAWYTCAYMYICLTQFQAYLIALFSCGMFIHSWFTVNVYYLLLTFFSASQDGTSEYNRLCGCVSNNIQAINKNGKLILICFSGVIGDYP